ncbi:nucleotide-binding protein [Paraburkholderia phenazinium]|uniref:Predicted nucleotide-binding protein containing TIR-like domain n=1 Tax=Paraburkholderia phenazinium TaxID=60549 RepID=A0A1N6EPX0_9BURK|nr:nucleotide-binding protein [Paraburkholderia phenazinium]SIN85055.1 Predicted nucleotide-binding protein containing TIR-like domain [Paraburkholderia phenazinium]
MSTTATPPSLSSAQIEHRIRALDEHVDQLRAIDVQTYSDDNKQILVALQARIRDTLERCFGDNSSRYRHFQGAGYLYEPIGRPGIFTKRGALEAQLREEVGENIRRSIGLLQSARASLQAELADIEHQLSPVSNANSKSMPLSRRVFVVHGHDNGARETVARFLEHIDFEPVILHEQANQGRTIIEKFEAHGDVGFAVVLLTPDDEGCVKGGELQPRARQNVVLELGYFIGRLGRNKVCALKSGDLELPSDYQGVLWETMDSGGGWKLKLASELAAAGYEVHLSTKRP